MSNSIKDSAQAFAVNQVLKYVDSNPQEAFPKLLDWADKFDKDNLYLTQRQQIRKVMEQPDSNWMRLINSLWTDIDSEVRKVFFRNFIVNASLLGSRKQVANREKYGCNIPWAILMDPTSACNLHCTGCWAAEYGNKLNLSYEELDDIINQANELGTYMFLYTGGEPMVLLGIFMPFGAVKGEQSHENNQYWNSCPCRRWKDDLDGEPAICQRSHFRTGERRKRDNEDGHHVFGAAAWDYHSSGSHFLPVAQM